MPRCVCTFPVRTLSDSTYNHDHYIHVYPVMLQCTRYIIALQLYKISDVQRYMLIFILFRNVICTLQGVSIGKVHHVLCIRYYIYYVLRNRVTNPTRVYVLITLHRLCGGLTCFSHCISLGKVYMLQCVPFLGAHV